jgi:hypothetical protein
VALRGIFSWRLFSRRGWPALLPLLLATVGQAEEPLLGRVLSIDEERGEILLLLDDAGGGERRLTLPIAEGEGARVGDLMRVWPGGVEAGGGLPVRLSPVHPLPARRDPTGVRSRLMRDRGHGSGRLGGGGRGR